MSISGLKDVMAKTINSMVEESIARESSTIRTSMGELEIRMGEITVLSGNHRNITAFATQTAADCARKGYAAGYFAAGPDNSEKYGNLLLLQNGKVNPGQLQKSRIRTEEMNQLESEASALSSLPIYFCDEPNISISGLCLNIAQMVIEKDVKMIFIDSLNYIYEAMNYAEGGYEQSIGSIIAKLGAVSKKFGISIILLIPVEREKEKVNGLAAHFIIQRNADVLLKLSNPDAAGMCILVNEKNNKRETFELKGKYDKERRTFSFN